MKRLFSMIFVLSTLSTFNANALSSDTYYSIRNAIIGGGLIFGTWKTNPWNDYVEYLECENGSRSSNSYSYIKTESSRSKNYNVNLNINLNDKKSYDPEIEAKKTFLIVKLLGKVALITLGGGLILTEILDLF